MMLRFLHYTLHQPNDPTLKNIFMISTPLSATTSKYEKDQIADHDVADFVIDGLLVKTFTI